MDWNINTKIVIEKSAGKFRAELRQYELSYSYRVLASGTGETPQEALAELPGPEPSTDTCTDCGHAVSVHTDGGHSGFTCGAENCRCTTPLRYLNGEYPL